MTLKECLLIANDCYKKNQKMNGNKPTGIVVHSTGANNKTLKRYVNPIPGQSNYNEIIADIGKNKYDNHWNHSAAEMNRSVCVHAFIGVNDAGKVETYQTLPFDTCCWGVGSGSKGSYNYNPQARIQFEMCEDDLTDAAYFNAVMKEGQEFCAFLCKKYGFGVDKICSHRESYLAGYGGNHGDPDHWLKKFGKDMDWFRAEVQKLLDADKPSEPAQPTEKVLYRVQIGAFSVKANADAMLQKAKAAGFTDAFITSSAVTTPAPSTPSAPKEETKPEPAPVASKKTVDEIAKEVINGKWGNGADRKNRLTAAGYNYSEIQARVNAMLK